MTFKRGGKQFAPNYGQLLLCVCACVLFFCVPESQGAIQTEAKRFYLVFEGELIPLVLWSLRLKRDKVALQHVKC